MNRKQLYYLFFSFIFLTLCRNNYLRAGDTTMSVICYDTRINFEKKIPVGCEMVDCCVGCPGSVIDLKLSFRAEAGVSLVFALENADKSLLQQLKLTGNIKWISKNELELYPGEIIIAGFPLQNNVILNPSFRIAPKILERKPGKVKPGKNPPPNGTGNMVTLNIKNYITDYLILERTYLTRLIFCELPPPPPLSDRIRLQNNTGNDIAGIVTDGRRIINVCTDDNKYTATDFVSVGNFLRNSNCNAESFVFSKDNAMAMVTPSLDWTDAVGNLQNINLAPMITVPVVVWLTQDIFRTHAVDEINLANLQLNASRSGILLVPTYEVVTPGAAELSFLEPMKCENTNQIINSRYYTPGKINIYYSMSVIDVYGTSTTGRCCFNNGHPEIIGISVSIAHIETLAHETGHSFSLGHTTDLDLNTLPPAERINVAEENLMYPRGVLGSARWFFTEGQDFRMNVNCPSTVNSLGLRPGEPTRNCFDGVSNNKCIRISLRF